MSDDARTTTTNPTTTRTEREQRRAADLANASSEELIELLASERGADRVRARRFLVARGKEALPLLIDALRDERITVRWEAAKALSTNEDARATEALVRALEDRSDIRWIAGEALAARGKTGLRAVLHALATRRDTPELRDGAHHVLAELEDAETAEALAPVIDALEHTGARFTAPVAAHQALKALDAQERRSRC